MAVPSKIEGLGQATLVPTANTQFDPTSATFSTEDYFMLTRVDGKTSLKELVLVSGFETQQAIIILCKLHDQGALLLPGEKPPVVSIAERVEPVEIDEALLKEEIDLSEEEKRAVLLQHKLVLEGNLFEMLGVSRDAKGRGIKRAYFTISKKFHPDRFFGKNLGSYRERLEEIFARCTRAYDILDDERQRDVYLNQLRAKKTGNHQAVQTPTQHAAELYGQACQLEAQGQVEQAARYFAAAVRVDPQPKYLRRAARFAIGQEQLSEAKEYAKKAMEIEPSSASSHRVFAQVLRAKGQTDLAREELKIACRLDPHNEAIAAELLACK